MTYFFQSDFLHNFVGEGRFFCMRDLFLLHSFVYFGGLSPRPQTCQALSAVYFEAEFKLIQQAFVFQAHFVLLLPWVLVQRGPQNIITRFHSLLINFNLHRSGFMGIHFIFWCLILACFVAHCGGLNRSGPHKLVCVNASHTGSGTNADLYKMYAAYP